MLIHIYSSGGGWHVQDLLRAARHQRIPAEAIDFRRVRATAGVQLSLPKPDCAIVRTMPPGSLEQVVFRMDVLHRLQAAGVAVLNSPASLETCIDKYLATSKL